MNESAQVHMMEIVVVISLLAVALFVVQGLQVSPIPTSHSKSQLKTLTDGMLLSLDAADATEEGYSSLLAEYVIKGMGGDDAVVDEFTAFIDTSVQPTIAMYNIWVYNTVDQMSDSCILLYPANELTSPDETVRVHQIITHDSDIYDVVVEIWYV